MFSTCRFRGSLEGRRTGRAEQCGRAHTWITELASESAAAAMLAARKLWLMLERDFARCAKEIGVAMAVRANLGLCRAVRRREDQHYSYPRVGARHGAAQLRVLLGGARRLYCDDHRRRYARCDRGASPEVFLLAIWRASEICIGIVCAGIVLAGTDLGGAQPRLASSIADLTAEVASSRPA
jgi:hypothetical protein